MALKTEQLINGAAATIVASDLTSGGTSLSVASSSGFPTDGNFGIRIGDEVIKVTAISGTTWTIVRAQDGTTGTSHLTGAAVSFCLLKRTLAGLQGSMYMADTWANRLVAAKVNSIYVTTDSNYISRYTGSAWEDYGPIFPIVPPASNFDSLYSWYQQGSATFTRIGMSWYLKIPAEATGTIRVLYKTAPATPYTIEAGFRFLWKNANYVSAGFIWKQSSDNKLTHLGIGYHSTPTSNHTLMDKYDGTGSFNSTYTSITASPRYSGMNYTEFFRITDNGTTRYFEWSQDGRNWMPYFSVGRTDFLTPNQIGFGIQTSNSADAFMEIFHYKEY